MMNDDVIESNVFRSVKYAPMITSTSVLSLLI
jgi:hypothetical protein